MKFLMDLFTSIVCIFLTFTFLQNKVIIVDMNFMDIAKLMAFVWCSMRLCDITIRKVKNFWIDLIDTIGDVIEEMK
jgi:hypothetical protein